MRRLVVMAVLPLVFMGQRPRVPADLVTMLREVGFSSRDFDALARGEAISRLVETGDPDITGAAAAVKINGRPEHLAEFWKRIEQSESGAKVTALGRFSKPPVLTDMRTLALSDEDLADLPLCRVGACQVNLSADAIDRFAREVNWDTSGADARAEQLTRQTLLDLLVRYQKGGNEAMVVYADGAEPMPSREHSLRLFELAVSLTRRLPPLATYFYYLPKAPLPAGAEEIYFWSQASFGLKPVTRVNHVVIAEVPKDQGFVMVSRQLYASHYFRDALEVRLVVPDTNGYYLACMNRAFSDSLRGITGTLIGGPVRSAIKSGMEDYVTATKRRMEGG